MPKVFNAAVEGYPDEAALYKLCEACHISLDFVAVKRGKGNLDKQLAAYNNAATAFPWIVLRDLDTDAPSACELVQKLLPNRSKYMLFRIAVRSIESWFLADRKSIAEFLHVSLDLIPRQVDQLIDPKQTMLNLARRSRTRALRIDMVGNTPPGSRKEGPAYASRLIEFALYKWQPIVAAQGSESMHRCLVRLTEAEGW
jgi:hypothetical protein